MMDKPTYEELETQVATLKSQLKDRAARRVSARQAGWRRLGIGLLITLGCLALVITDLGLWANRTIISHDGYMAAVSPLVKDPAVQTAMVKATQDQIESNVDISQTVKDVLPDRAAFLAGPISTGVINSIHAFLTRAVQSDKFAQAWTTVNDRAHASLANYVTKYEGDGQITVADAAAVLSNRLQSTPLANVASKPLPPKFGDIELINASWLPIAHDVTEALKWSVPIGIVVALLGFGGAIWWSAHRRKTVIVAATAAAFALGLANIAVRLVQQVRQGRIADADYRAAAHAVSQALLGPFIAQTRAWIVLALVVIVVAWASGRSPAATSLRAGFRHGAATVMNATGNLGSGNPAVAWLHRHRRIVEWAFVALAVLVLMFLTPLTVAIVSWTAVALVILLVLVEVITSTASREAGAGRVAP